MAAAVGTAPLTVVRLFSPVELAVPLPFEDPVTVPFVPLAVDVTAAEVAVAEEFVAAEFVAVIVRDGVAACEAVPWTVPVISPVPSGPAPVAEAEAEARDAVVAAAAALPTVLGRLM